MKHRNGDTWFRAPGIEMFFDKIGNVRGGVEAAAAGAARGEGELGSSKAARGTRSARAARRGVATQRGRQGQGSRRRDAGRLGAGATNWRSGGVAVGGVGGVPASGRRRPVPVPSASVARSPQPNAKIIVLFISLFCLFRLLIRHNMFSFHTAPKTRSPSPPRASLPDPVAMASIRLLLASLRRYSSTGGYAP